MAKSGPILGAESLKAEITKAMRPGRFIDVAGLGQFEDRLHGLLIQAGNLSRSRESAEVAAFLISAVLDKERECEQFDEDGSALRHVAVPALISWFDRRSEAGVTPASGASIVAEWLKRDDFGSLAEAKSAILLYFEDCLAEFESALVERFTLMDRAISEYLAEIYIRTENADKYIALRSKGLCSRQDNDQIVTLLEKAGRNEEALDWARKSEGLEHRITQLLLKAGRIEGAERSALALFRQRPGVDTYEALMACTTPDRRPEVSAEAMECLETAPLANAIRVCVAIGEREILAKRIESAPEEMLRAMSHYDTEPAAKMLVAHAPRAAARMFHILALRILDDSKSAYYDYALDHLDCARECLTDAGEHSEWDKIRREIEQKHYRKPGIKKAFPAVIRGRWIRTDAFISQISSTSRE